MPRKHPKYVVSDTDRHGTPRWYFRRKGMPKVRLPNPDDFAFGPAYELAAQGIKPDLKPAPRVVARRPATSGYVYFLRANAAIKIGFSVKPLSRFVGLRTGLAMKVTSFVTIPGTVADERALHRKFAAHRLEGEWFSQSPDIIQAMAQAAAYGRVDGVGVLSSPTMEAGHGR